MPYKYTNSKLLDIKKNKKNMNSIAEYYKKMSSEFDAEKFFNNSYLIYDCMFYWQWDKYEKNKTLELTKLSRCKDKFCSNCKQISVASSLFKVMPYFLELQKKGYKPLLLTLTIPNVDGEDLAITIDKLFKKFKVFYEYYSKPIKSKKSYKKRSFSFIGAIRALEITYNKDTDTYHPHIHIMAFAEGEFVSLEKTMKYSSRLEKYQVSKADIEIRSLWTNLYNDKDQRTIGQLKENELYMCDIREIADNKGILETLKYTFKNSEIANYDVFKTLYFALWNRKAKQGYGTLYSLKFDDTEDIRDDTAPLFEDEVPEDIVINLNDLISLYKKYEKISRFRARDFLPIVQKNISDWRGSTWSMCETVYTKIDRSCFICQN